MKKVAIIGSHGLYANYGGWDQLVRNLAEKKDNNKIEYLIFNSSDSPVAPNYPQGIVIRKLIFKASGFEGLFYDFWSILVCYWNVDTILFLGVQGIPLLPILRIFKKIRIVSNVGGIEWERPKFNLFSKKYLKYCFNLSFKYSDYVVLDNQHYKVFAPQKSKAQIIVLPYGGEIDSSLELTDDLLLKYPFLNEDYFLSISRSLVDNQIDELCDCFRRLPYKLVLISNFSKSEYGLRVFEKYNGVQNIILIDGLYLKPELDLVRRKCKAYIHTHTLCGTAPSLVEMIIAGRPIISTDNPQNRFTLNNQGFFYSSFEVLKDFIDSNPEYEKLIPSSDIGKQYEWSKIVSDYESLF